MDTRIVYRAIGPACLSGRLSGSWRIGYSAIAFGPVGAATHIGTISSATDFSGGSEPISSCPTMNNSASHSSSCGEEAPRLWVFNPAISP